jgi:hypothetical protein
MELSEAMQYIEDFKNHEIRSDCDSFCEKYPPISFGLIDNDGIYYLEAILKRLHEANEVIGKITTSTSKGRKDLIENILEITEERLPNRELINPSKVTLAFGVTKSVGNFEFVRFDVGAEDFCETRKKQETWDNLEAEVSKRMEKLISNIKQYETPEVKESAGSSLPPLDEVPEVVEKKGNAPEVLRKEIHKEVLKLAKLSKINYIFAIRKLQEVIIDEDFGTKLLKELQNNNLTFFTGVNNGEPETNGSEDSKEE